MASRVATWGLRSIPDPVNQFLRDNIDRDWREPDQHHDPQIAAPSLNAERTCRESSCADKPGQSEDEPDCAEQPFANPAPHARERICRRAQSSGTTSHPSHSSQA